jgi:hypothetical protein
MGEEKPRKGSRWARVLVFGVLGLLFALLGVSIVCALGERFLEKPPLSQNALWALGGAGVYLLLHLFFHRPILSHILAHELTHALAALLSGGKVTAVHATTEGGSTLINRSHWLISLAPYVFPFYSALALLVWVLAAPTYRPYLSGLVGFLYAFHGVLTLTTLAHPQPDLEEAGMAFSLIFIFTGNMMIFMVLTLLLWPEAFTFTSAFERTMAWSFRIVTSVGSLLSALIPAGKADPP